MCDKCGERVAERPTAGVWRRMSSAGSMGVFMKWAVWSSLKLTTLVSDSRYSYCKTYTCLEYFKIESVNPLEVLRYSGHYKNLGPDSKMFMKVVGTLK